MTRVVRPDRPVAEARDHARGVLEYLYQWTLYLYPKAFHGDDLRFASAAFRDARRAVRAESGRLAATWIGLRHLVKAIVGLPAAYAELREPDAPDLDDHRPMTPIRFHLVQACKSLRRAPGYAAAFVLTLGLAVGVNSAVFSVVNAVLLQPLPVPEADRILYLKHAVRGLGIEHAMFSFMEVDDYRRGATTLDEIVEFRGWEFTVVGEGEPQRAIGGMITSNYFNVMGLRPALGRVLNGEDDALGAAAAIVLTDAYWERAFGRDPSVIGRTLELESLRASDPLTAVQVVGVLEPGFRYTGSSQPDFYANYSSNAHYQDGSMRDSRSHRMTDIFVRMAPDVSFEAATAELQSIQAGALLAFPAVYAPERRYGLDVVRWKDELARDSRATFLVLVGTVVVILLLAAANVTSLTLTRLIKKQSELSTRAALGARARDLRMQLTAEHVVLGLIAGALGVLLAIVSRDALVAYAGRLSVRAQEVSIDWTVVGVTLGGSLALAVLLAWLPGLPVNPGVSRVASGVGRTTDSRVRRQVQRGLVVGQLALSFTLLTGAGLLVRSLWELTSVDAGFQTEQVLAVRAPTGPRGIPYLEADPGWEAAVEEIRSYPGVREAAVATWAPLDTPTPPIAWGIILDGGEEVFDRSHLSSGNTVSPGYFEILEIPLVSGRYFDQSDREGATPVIILNASMARTHFGDASPIGRRVQIEPDGLTVFSRRWYEVVGVVADAREHGTDIEGMHTYYRPSAQNQWGPAVLVAHEGDPAGVGAHVRDVLHRMQPNRAVQQPQTLTALLERDRAPARLNAVLLGSFAALALLIAALGVLGTLAFSVSQRNREFSIRMAVGADRGNVLRDVLGEGAIMVGVALLLGLIASLLLGRFLSGFLFRVDWVDPLAIGAAAGVLGTVALTAALLPALRATKIDPSDVLRGQ